MTQAAVNHKKRGKLLPLIILYYRITSFFSKKHIADKSHPNIWLVEKIMKYVPNSYFIGIIRNPHPTVSSMLLHDGVSKWIKEWKKYPIPNEFLGITNQNVEQYSKMQLEAKCTMRWIAHRTKFNEIEEKYPDKFLMIDYEKLFDNAEEQLDKVKLFLELHNDLPLPEIKQESKLKWRSNLNNEQIKIINKTLADNNYSTYRVNNSNKN